MARCTAPINGHRTASARANCPACGGGSRYNSYSSYSSPSSFSSFYGNSSGGSSTSTKSTTRNSKVRWAKPGSTVVYSVEEVRTLTPIRHQVEELTSTKPDLRDVFLCHAWDDRKAAAKDLHDLLESVGVKVWFSEKDVALGQPLLRAIDKGLVNSKVGIVLVTPALLKRLSSEGIADKELSVLLATDRLIPIVHETTYDELREISPLLASRSGLDTSEDSLEDIAAKLAELVHL